MAILAGDALLTRCFQLLADLPQVPEGTRVEIIHEISRAAGTVNGMIGGQVVDLESEGKPVTPEILEYIHSSKTGALLTACSRCGALAAGANPDQLHALTDYGRKTGLVFKLWTTSWILRPAAKSWAKLQGRTRRRRRLPIRRFSALKPPGKKRARWSCQP